MTSTGAPTLLWMIPLNLLLVAWVWIGRIVFGVGGWFFLIFLFSIVPVVLIAPARHDGAGLHPARPPALADPLPGRARSCSPGSGCSASARSCPDFGDTEDSQLSLLTQVFGYTDAVLDAELHDRLGFAGLAVVVVRRAAGLADLRPAATTPVAA